MWPAQDPETGAALTGPSQPCIIFAHTRPQWDLIDESNPATGGLRITYQGLVEPSSDAFNKCPTSPVYGGGPIPRILRINLLCDASGSSSDVKFVANPATPSDPTTFYDEIPSGSCIYELTASTKAACGTKGDPFSLPPASTPGANFGYTVLGSVLTVGIYSAFLFVDARGYLDGIKARLPSWAGGRSYAAPPSGGFASSGGAYGSA